MKPAKTDKKAPKTLTLRIEGAKKKQWCIATGTLRQFKEGKGSMGYNFSTRLQNPENGEQYILSANLVLLGSAPSTNKPKKAK